MSRRTIDPDKKYEAVMEVLSRHEPLSVIAHRYGMSEQSLRNAKDQFLAGAKDALQSKSSNEHKREIEKLSREVAERDRVIGEITIANRILKKKVDGYF